jgi:hypothetical protein
MTHCLLFLLDHWSEFVQEPMGLGQLSTRFHNILWNP